MMTPVKKVFARVFGPTIARATRCQCLRPGSADYRWHHLTSGHHYISPQALDEVAEHLAATPPTEPAAPEAETTADLIERSSLGTPEAKALRATVSDERAAGVVARSKELAEAETAPTEPACDLELQSDVPSPIDAGESATPPEAPAVKAATDVLSICEGCGKPIVPPAGLVGGHAYHGMCIP